MSRTLIACLAVVAIGIPAYAQTQYWVELDGPGGNPVGSNADQSSVVNIGLGGSAIVAIYIDDIPQGEPDGCEQCVRGAQIHIPNSAVPPGPTLPFAGAANNSDTHPDGLITLIDGPCNLIPDGCLGAFPPVDFGTAIRIGTVPGGAMGGTPVPGPTYVGEVTVETGDAEAGSYTLDLDQVFTFIMDENNTTYNVSFTTLTINIVGPPTPPFIVHEDAEDASTRPCSGYIDPRRESTNGDDVNLGMMSADILFSEAVFGDDAGGPVATANFTLTDCDGEAGPIITDVTMIGGDPAYLRVSWDGVLALQKWTTLQASVWDVDGLPIDNEGDLGDDNEPDRMDFANLPADIDQNERVQPLDLLRMRQRLLGSCTAACPDCGGRDDFYFDIDRNGSVQALDLLRWRQLWFGSSIATQVWQGVQTTCDRP